ncbi:MAG: hypothetical protein HYT09_02850 [Candidatus Levybacteria bacterium]|nr:hypothetical protein [Candidatus Levybacteria bacterium]MBI4098228.1 hypothetical protein [Candidatus Levybacteria bacterium]
MRSREKGTSLIEALVALSIAVVIISGITAVVITSLNNTTYTKFQNQATSFSQEGLEIVRQLAGSDYTSFENTYAQTNYCLGESGILVNKADVGTCANESVLVGKYFLREVTIDLRNASCIQGPTPVGEADRDYARVIVTVSWSDSKCTEDIYCHKIDSRSCIVDSSAVPSPI